MKIDTIATLTPVEHVSEADKVNARLTELGLTWEGLLHVANVAVNERRSVTKFNASNAAGTLAYQHAVAALRRMFDGHDGWTIDRFNNIECILNVNSGVRVAFSNVDIAGDRNYRPKPTSEKKSGSYQICQDNLFGYLPEFSRPAPNGSLTYYLLVDSDGRAELSLPIVEDNTFASYPERIYLKSDSDASPDAPSLDVSDVLDDFDPIVAPKIS